MAYSTVSFMKFYQLFSTPVQIGQTRGETFPITATFIFCDSFLICKSFESEATSPQEPFHPDGFLLFLFVCLFIFANLFIYLAALGVSCSMQDF